MVEFAGETVCVPFTGTSPMPSIVTTVAFEVRQFRTSDWPRSIANGSALRLAVGAAAAVAGGSAFAGTAAGFLWQPVTVNMARLMAQTARARVRFGEVAPRDDRLRCIVFLSRSKTISFGVGVLARGYAA